MTTVPKCCENGKLYMRLSYGAFSLYYGQYTSRQHFLEVAKGTIPAWTLEGAGVVSAAIPAISYCPWCGAEAPLIRLKNKQPKRIIASIDGGYYCSTCEKRLMECKCKPAEDMWELLP